MIMATLEKRLKYCKFSGVTPTPSVNWPVSGVFSIYFDSDTFQEDPNLGPGIVVPSSTLSDYEIISLDGGDGFSYGDAKLSKSHDEIVLNFTGVFSGPGAYNLILEIFNEVDEEDQFGVCREFATVYADGHVESDYLVLD